MATIRFDERWLASALRSISGAHRAIFAACCAQRTLPGLVEASGGGTFALAGSALDALWASLEGGALCGDQLHRLREQVFEAIPQDETGVATDFRSLGPMSAICYAIDSLIEPDTRNPILAARVVIDLLDAHIQESRGISPYEPDGERRIAHSDLMQQEILRQHRGIEALAEAARSQPAGLAARALRQRAEQESCLAMSDPP